MSLLHIPTWLVHWRGRPHASLRATDRQLLHVRLALRLGDLDWADAALRGCGDAADADADCLNLAGVIAERRGQWQVARRYWVRAARADKACLAARRNLARYYELFTWGRCRDRAAIGDEPDASTFRCEERS